MTRAARIDALLATVAPAMMEEHRKTGLWPFKPGQEGALEAHMTKRRELADAGHLKLGDETQEADYAQKFAAARRDSPYRILADETQTKLFITTDDGDTISASGPTLDDAISAMEVKVGAQRP